MQRVPVRAPDAHGHLGRAARTWRRWSAPRRPRSTPRPRPGRAAARRGRCRPRPAAARALASDSTAGSSPRSVSTAGWMPRASSRSSSSASVSSSPARVEVGIVADAGAPPSAASARARRAAAARRRAGCAPAAAARRRPPRRCGRARRRAPRATLALASAWAASSAKSAIRCSAPGGNGSGVDAGDDHRAPQPPVEEDRPGDGARRKPSPRSRRGELAVEIARSRRSAPGAPVR